jgi:4-hydroxy-3-polyprenylbenzoate decarboxylase
VSAAERQAAGRESPGAALPGPVVVGVTGASGAVYAQRLVRWLLERDFEVHLTVSAAGRVVVKEELGPAAGDDPWGQANRDRLKLYHEKDYYAPFCSGSFRFRGMAVIPASMGTVGAIASGAGTNIIHRGADVALKEKIPLVVVPRETPFSTIHLENLLALARAGAVILPPSPAFYQRPRTLEDQVDFVVSRVLDALAIENQLFRRWSEERP